MSQGDTTNCKAMPASGRRLAARCPRMAALALVMLIGWLAQPGDAHAQCAHYVAIGNPSPAARAYLEGASHSHAIHRPPGPLTPASPNKPCNGPQCRGQESPTAPPPAPPLTISSGSDQLAAIFCFPDLPTHWARRGFTSDWFDLTSAHLQTAEPPPR